MPKERNAKSILRREIDELARRKQFFRLPGRYVPL
jgi:hypothetical protein